MRPANPNQSKRKPVKQYKVAEKPPVRERSARARELRMKARGRLPVGSRFDNTTWDGTSWTTVLVVPEPAGPVQMRHTADGLFRLLEELDIMYWELLAQREVTTVVTGEGEAGG